MRRKTLFVFLMFSFISLLFSCKESGNESRKAAGGHDAVAVRVKSVDKIKQQAIVSSTGTIELRESVELAFQVSGKVTQVFIKEGDTVKANQVLAEVDPIRYKLAVDAAMTTAAEARMKAARAEDQFHRMKRLFDRKGLSPGEFKKFEAAHLASRAALRRAESRAANARKELTDTRLASPIKGVIASQSIASGETAVAGTPVFTVADLDLVNVRISIPEAEIGRVRAGQPATVQVPSLSQQLFEGKVESAATTADPSTGTFVVKIAVPNPRQVLRGGMPAEARIHTDVMVELIAVPAEAVVSDPQGGTLVYVYDPAPKKVFARRVETGSVYDREIEIKKGLAGDEPVVVSGQDRLADGAPVDAVEVN